MACPFDERPVDIGAQIIRAIHRERLIRPRLDILAYPDDFLLERYRFSRKSLIYLSSLLQPYIANTTNRGPGLSSLQTMCSPAFFANGSFLYNVGDAEHISVLSDDPSTSGLRFSSASYRTKSNIGMPRGAYNRKYKIVLTDLHPLENV